MREREFARSFGGTLKGDFVCRSPRNPPRSRVLTARGCETQRRVAGEVGVEDDGAGGIEDADVHGPGMQVDAAVEWVLSGVEAHHHGLLGRGPDPASWLITLWKRLHGAGVRAESLQQTAAAMTVSGT
jgi:hypothetical protein